MGHASQATIAAPPRSTARRVPSPKTAEIDGQATRTAIRRGEKVARQTKKALKAVKAERRPRAQAGSSR